MFWTVIRYEIRILVPTGPYPPRFRRVDRMDCYFSNRLVCRKILCEFFCRLQLSRLLFGCIGGMGTSAEQPRFEN